jgi:hypothetical protein
MACDTCRQAAKSLLRLRNANGHPFFMPGKKDDYHEDFHPLWEAARTGTVTSILPACGLFEHRQEGGFSHFSVKTSSNIPEERAQELGYVMHKYMPLVRNLFLQNGMPGIHASLDALLDALPNVTYGSKLTESARWFRKHVREDFKELSAEAKLSATASAVLDLKAEPEAGGGYSLPAYHQFAKNTLNALECARDVPALEKLLQNRLSPLNYQVKTADPTDGQVEMALKHIGDFGVRLMTVEEAVQNGATLVRWKTRTSAGSAFSSMKNGKKGKAAGFAGRARVVVRPHTMTELMENVPECLEINVDSQTPCYANEFDGLKNGVYQEQFTWNFMNGRRPDAVGLPIHLPGRLRASRPKGGMPCKSADASVQPHMRSGFWDSEPHHGPGDPGKGPIRHRRRHLLRQEHSRRHRPSHRRSCTLPRPTRRVHSPLDTRIRTLCGKPRQYLDCGLC